MPRYRVLLSGTGVSIPRSEGEDPIIGFFTTREVVASDPRTAESIAVNNVAEEWSKGEYASANLGSPPLIQVDDTWQVRWWQRLRRNGIGYIFYGPDPPAG